VDHDFAWFVDPFAVFVECLCHAMTLTQKVNLVKENCVRQYCQNPQ
jgi:hypothetical protein